jgi:hypothetical protein
MGRYEEQNLYVFIENKNCEKYSHIQKNKCNFSILRPDWNMKIAEESAKFSESNGANLKKKYQKVRF